MNNMSLIIESSSRNFQAAILEDWRIIGTINKAPDQLSKKIEISEVVNELFNLYGVSPDHIKNIIVDRGPGNLSSVRAGMAYGLGFAFAKQCRLLTVCSLDLIGIPALEQEPTVIVTRKGIPGTGYMGVYKRSMQPAYYFGDIDNIVAIIKEQHQAQICGTLAKYLQTSLPECALTFLDFEFPDLKILFNSKDFATCFQEMEVSTIKPLTDESTDFFTKI